MGKIRVKTIGLEEEEEKQKLDAKKRKEAKIVEAKAKAATLPAEPEVVVESTPKVQSEEVKDAASAKKENPPSRKASHVAEAMRDKSHVAEAMQDKSAGQRKEKFQKNNKTGHSAEYLTKAALVDKSKKYSLEEALSLLPKLQHAKFDETVELHINTTEQGVSGSVTLPHGTGKTRKIEILSGQADPKHVDEVIKQIEDGNINFDVLIATPDVMPRLAKVARFLGPRGLMPNPKNGTVTSKPEEVAKQYAGGHMTFKTEVKSPVIHLTVGKVSYGGKLLEENIKTVLKAVQTGRIKSMTLKSTMSPGIKVQV